MSRLFLTAAIVALAAGAAQAQRVDVDPARRTSLTKPIPARPGDLIASDISDTDFNVGPQYDAEHFFFTGRAGQTVTAQVASDIPTLEVLVRQADFRSPQPLARGPARDAPLSVVLPKDGYYYLIVSAQGPQRQGKYLLSLGVDGQAPPLAASQPAQVAQAALAAPPRYEVDPKRWTASAPIYTRPGELVAGEISAVDIISGVERSGDVLLFQGRAGETITAQVRSDVPSLLVAIQSQRRGLNLNPLVEGPARDAPIRLVLPKDDTYEILVHTQGPQRYGDYLLSIGSADGAPPFDPPKPTPVVPVRVAQAPQPPAPTPAAPTALPKLTPPPGVLAAEIGTPVARPAGKPGPGVDLYAFIGEAGSVLQATAAGTGGYGVTIYTPEGAEMLTATGLGSARLTAVLPQDAVYLLAVARQDAAKPYKLDLAAERPDLFQWGFRSSAGYETLGADGKVAYWSCWISPGAVLRYQHADGKIQTLTVQRGGVGRWDYVYDGKPSGYSFTTRIEGAKVIRTSERNSVQTWSLDDPPSPHGAYRGYLCQ